MGPLDCESPDVSSLKAAILQAVAYSDVFDYPLTATEVHCYLVGLQASPVAVQAVLDGPEMVPHHLARRQEYFTLPGREEIVETRRRRQGIAARVWPRAVRYGSIIAQLPFVRMVAMTGALAVDNVESDADFDYLIVTKPSRLWLCRAFVIVLTQWAARRGDHVCPNYFLSERALALSERTLFTAHELVQMVPIAGLSTYRRMCQLNAWAAHFLPNACDELSGVGVKASVSISAGLNSARSRYVSCSLAEAALTGPAGSWLERWEMTRKVRKFTRWRNTLEGNEATTGGNGHFEATFSADRCKGHFDKHGQHTLEAFAERMKTLDLPLPQTAEPAVGLEARTFGGLT